ncbi:Aste57867_23634 [Aphanomyces stellatus]|uniref:Aste57867_23634 protein n=1 Tax=Aphanomyces stellatus TaxID=120398 RepID=A0A485LPW2_9STRA|nr:hypothetical protein As57867_023562 [Aphanomyces stellatus]VFU00279.1 Aste57867_23634 [Aphanomyces stellatus]
MSAAHDTAAALVGHGLAQMAIALGSVVYFPRWLGPLETNHPDALALAVVMVATFTFPLLILTAPRTPQVRASYSRLSSSHVRVYKVHSSTLAMVAAGVGMTVVGVGVFHLVIIFFGAPLFLSVFNDPPYSPHNLMYSCRLWWKTLLLAALISIMTVAPLAMHIGVGPSTRWIDLLLNARYRRARDIQLAWTCIGTLLGTYLGTVFLPLDWDRPWQQWPLPCVYGAAYGHALGALVSTVAAAFFWDPKYMHKED